MGKLLKVVLAVSVVSLTIGMSSCVRGRKACKANHKKVNKMRKSGQLGVGF